MSPVRLWVISAPCPDASGRQIKSAGPSVPVEIMGLPAVPEAGEIFYSVDDEKMAKQLAEKRRVKQREDEMKQSSRISLDTLFSKMAEGEVKDLNLIVKRMFRALLKR